MSAGDPQGSDDAVGGVPEPGSRIRNRAVRALRVVYLVGLAVLLVWLVWRRRTDIALLVSDTRPAMLLAAFGLALGQLLPSVAFWTVGLRELGDQVRFGGVLAATARSLPARYVPGSVWYALGRASLLRRDQRVSKRGLAAAAVLESVLAVVVAIVMGTAFLAAAGRFPGRGPWLAAWFAILAVVGSPPVVNRMLALVARRRGGVARTLSWRGWARLVAVTGVHWAWSAATFTVYLRAFPDLSLVTTFEIVGSFLVAWVVGFLAVFAPQGAGVFEAAVAAMLVEATAATAPVAVVAAGYRALMLLRDGAVFALAWLRRR